VAVFCYTVALTAFTKAKTLVVLTPRHAKTRHRKVKKSFLDDLPRLIFANISENSQHNAKMILPMTQVELTHKKQGKKNLIRLSL
jgi:hypothetical protein